MRSLLPWVGLLLLAPGCDEEARAAERSEAERIVLSVRELRAAESSAKEGSLDQLKQQPCKHPKLCSLRDACAHAYTLHQRGQTATRALGARLKRDGGADGAAAQLALAEKDLADARVETRRCADLEGETVRQYGLN